MARISYEGNTLIYIQEGIKRNAYYFTDPQIYSATEHTISTIVQKGLQAKKNRSIKTIDDY